MKSNADKCYLIVSANNNINIKIGSINITGHVRNFCMLNLIINWPLIITFPKCVKKVTEKFMISKSNTIYEYIEKNPYTHERV